MSPVFPVEVTSEMARRQQRFHHYIWHKLRNAWERLTENEKQAVREVNPLWVPPRSALNALGRPKRDNDSGEDFLFMYNEKIAIANEILAQVKHPDYPRVEGWELLPAPGDVNYPVPEFPDSGLEVVKADKYYADYLLRLERHFTNRDYLRSVTLGQLGSDIEFGIHQDMHLRWAQQSAMGYRPPTAITGSIERKWDAPEYDYLGDTYSCGVNPIFWKLNGWVSARVNDWKQAHGIVGEYEWKGTWVGVLPTGLFNKSDPSTLSQDRALAELESLDQITSTSRASEFDGFFRKSVRLPQNAMY